MPSISSTRQIVFDPTTSKCCGIRPGFWRQVPIPRSAMGRGGLGWQRERSSFPTAENRMLSTRWPRHLPKPRSSPLPSRRPRKESAAASAPTTTHWSTRLSSGRVFIARACPIASRLASGRATRPAAATAVEVAQGIAARQTAASILRLVFRSLGGLALGAGRRLLSFPVGRRVRRRAPGSGTTGCRLSGHAARRLRRRAGRCRPAPGGRFGTFTSAAAGAASFGLTLTAGGGGGGCPSSSWPESTSM